jgi:hypothetical protein
MNPTVITILAFITLGVTNYILALRNNEKNLWKLIEYLNSGTYSKKIIVHRHIGIYSGRMRFLGEEGNKEKDFYYNGNETLDKWISLVKSYGIEDIEVDGCYDGIPA